MREQVNDSMYGDRIGKRAIYVYIYITCINVISVPFVISGSHPHNDPDLMGAWAYLVNGFKWWVIFPQGKFALRFRF